MKQCRLCNETKPLDDFYNKSRRNGTIGKSARCKPCEKLVKAKRYDALKKRKADLMSSFGLSLEAYDELLKSQNGVCAICHGPHKGRGEYFHVDHNHKTGAVRGLLCGPCNVGLGLMREDIDLINKAIAYLKNHAT